MIPMNWRRLRRITVLFAVVGMVVGFGGIWFDANIHIHGIGKLLTLLSIAGMAATLAAAWASCSATRTMTIRFSVLAAALLILPLLALALAMTGGFGVPV